jgi:hypothetical protein
MTGPARMDEYTRIAMRVADRVRAQAAAHPATGLAVAGLVAGWLIIVAGGQIGTVRSVIPLTSWLGLMSRNGQGSDDYIPGTVMLAGIVALALLWMWTLRLVRTRSMPESRVWAIGAAWAVPFVVGPPLMSNDIWTYAAQGLLARSGLDPYSVGPAALGDGRAVAAVDPTWRNVPSPYGPLATTMQHLAVAISGGDPLGAVVVFRALGVVCLVMIGLLAADLAGPRRASAVAITVLNPLLLLQVVSAAHLDAVMTVLALGSLAAANRRRWLVAIVLAAAAGSVKAPGFLAVLAIIAWHQNYQPSWRRMARDCGVALVAVVGFSAVTPNGWGWTRALNASSLGHTALAPASLLSDLFDPLIPTASFDDLATAGRITALIAAGCIIMYLTITPKHRPLDRTVGYGLLAFGVLSPVVYPWYLLGGVACLVPNAQGSRRDWLILLSVIGCVLSPPGFSTVISTTISVAAAAIALGAMARRAAQRRIPADAERTPADLPAVGTVTAVPLVSRPRAASVEDGLVAGG